jgi:nitrite reductase (NADH) large subunit
MSSARIGVIGAGHAGVEAARAAREAGAAVTLFSAEGVVPYFRPRLVAYAFGHAELSAIQMRPREWYAQQGIDLRLNAPVASLDASRLEITVQGRVERFDGMVLASGAAPGMPAFAASGGAAVSALWSIADADAIRGRIRPGGQLVVVGGGILGIEAALRAQVAGMKVEIVEIMERLMPAQFGQRASTVLRRRLMEKGIAVTLGRSVAAAAPMEDGGVELRMDDGRALKAQLCLVSVGARPQKSLALQAGLSVGRGVTVDAALRTSAPRCFGAGDVIEILGVTRCSVREAAGQGRTAGVNAVAAQSGGALQSYQPETLPLIFRSGDFEIYSLGQPGGVGYEEHLLDVATDSMIRALILKDGIPLGVQMIGTREGFDEWAAKVRVRETIDHGPQTTDHGPQTSQSCP